MTNKETATMLKWIRELFSVNYAPEYIAALSKAIELIEQMPEEHGDLIDRDELKEKFFVGDFIGDYARKKIDAAPIIIAEERSKRC